MYNDNIFESSTVYAPGFSVLHECQLLKLLGSAKCTATTVMGNYGLSLKITCNNKSIYLGLDLNCNLDSNVEVDIDKCTYKLLIRGEFDKTKAKTLKQLKTLLSQNNIQFCEKVYVESDFDCLL